ncbi:MAG: DUF4013 domain-containing protein [Candidatus Aenigmatarchaeota archaeon]
MPAYIIVDYGRAIKRPFSDAKKLVIGIIVSIIPFVNFIAAGYHLACAKTAMKKKFELPEWEDLGGLFVKGVVAEVIAILYIILPMAVMVIAGVNAVLSLVTAMASGAQGAGMGAALLGAGAGFLLGAILMLIMLYLLPAAILGYVKSDKFGAAFRLGEVFGKAFRVDYFVAFVFVALYGGIISVILSIVPYFGTMVAWFISGVTAMTVFAEVYESK